MQVLFKVLKASDAEIKQTRDHFQPIARREYHAKLIFLHSLNILRLVHFYFACALLECIVFKMHFCTFKSTLY